MEDQEEWYVSLCRVNRPDKNNDVWVRRMADLCDGELVKFNNENSIKIGVSYKPKFQYGKDRPFIFNMDGPRIPNVLGIWMWRDYPKPDNPEKYWVESKFVGSKRPLRVVSVPNAHTIENLGNLLKNEKIPIPSGDYICDILFCFQSESGMYKGVLCKYDQDLNFKDGYVGLSARVVALPCFIFKEQDIFNYDESLHIILDANLGKPAEYVNIEDPLKAVRDIVIKHFSWNNFKNNVVGTKAEWQKCKLLFSSLCENTLYYEVSKVLYCTEDKAKIYIEELAEKVNALLETGDIDIEILAQIVKNHDGLRLYCEEKIASEWHKNNEKALNDAKSILEKIQCDIDLKRDEKKSLDQELSSNQSKLDDLCDQIASYKKIEEGILDAIRKKISEARDDMTGFVADLSIIMPQLSYGTGNKLQRSWKYNRVSVETDSEDVDRNESWKDEIYCIESNLSEKSGNVASFIGKKLVGMLAAFLYSTHLRHVPVLAAGPYGMEMVQALSAAIYGKVTGCLSLGNEYDPNIVGVIDGTEDNIVVIENMFNRGWSDSFPKSFMNIDKHLFWTHPYVEDLFVEPKGLYNYCMPLFTECFIEGRPSANFLFTKRCDEFEEFDEESGRLSLLKYFERLKLSKFLLNRLELIFSDMKKMTNESENDIEVLFGILPFSVLLGKVDVLRDILDENVHVSSFIKNIAERYISDE